MPSKLTTMFALAVMGSVLAVPTGPARADVERRQFTRPEAYLVVEVLDDDLVHFELSPVGTAPPLDQPLYTSPMVLATDQGGPSRLTGSGDRLETADLRLTVDPATLCVAIEDRTRDDAPLTRVCPSPALLAGEALKGLEIEPGTMTQVYGLGQEFKTPGSADGDWIRHGVRRGRDGLGNGFAGFEGGAVGNVQIPVLYALADDGLNYALFMDNVYHQEWRFDTTPWQARMFGDQLRWYILSGPDLPDLRSDFMELVGTPPVPPRKAFGLWVSEFGYDTFGQVGTLLAGLRAGGFPVDGFVLDLNWFGGVVPGDRERSTMGRLDWDEDQAQPPILSSNPYSFQDPETRIQAFHDDHVGLTVIEESYLADRNVDTFHEMPSDLNAYQRSGGVCDPANQTLPVLIDATDFFGVARMIDWSDPAARAWIHDNRRRPNLSRLGVTAHWTDLGEPERKDPAACYQGVETTASGLKNEHPDIHNLYNLLWVQGIWDGYEDGQGQANALGIRNPRPFILTRSGAAGVQRYGAAMWSGDIASNLRSLATHYNAQMHMTFSGIDYYGADIGGFRRETLPHNDDDGSYRGFEAEMYTQWLANAVWTDVPVRPHTDNEFKKVSPPYPTSPHETGDPASNLANLRERYALIPYYYSLAHEAHQSGAPVVAPPVLYHQTDPSLRGVGHETMIGRDLLVGIVARHGEHERDVYLPAGRWADYHSNEWVTSDGQTVADVPAYRNGLLRIPVFARGGAILPRMAVDADTKDAFGHRDGAAPKDELILRVYADPEESAFTLFEDDGRTLQYDADGRPRYHHRTTRVTQRQDGPSSVTVTVDPAVDVNGSGPFPGAVLDRPTLIELVVEDSQATAVALDGAVLPEQPTRQAFDTAASGWINAGRNLVLARSASLPVSAGQTFRFSLEPVAGRTSVNFVCENGVTTFGESVYVVGGLPGLGAWDPARAVKLEPSVYYEYIHSPPPGGQTVGPRQPVWTGIVEGLPPQPGFEWKCLKRREDGSGDPIWQPGANNMFGSAVASGYAGRAYGAL